MNEPVNRIKKYRTELNLSLKDLAKLTGISSSSLQRYETSDGGNLSIDNMITISSALNVSPLALIGLESKDLPFKDFKYISSLLELNNKQIDYNGKTDRFMLIENNDFICYLQPEQIRTLSDKTISYFNFELQNIISKNTIE